MNELKKLDEYFPCRVCGYNMEFDAWGGDENLNPTYMICHCCGAEAGTDDYNIEVVRQYRQDWIDSGANWFTPSAKTTDWNLEHQLTKIPEHWL